MVYVKWADAHSVGAGEFETEEIMHRPYYFETVGWLVKSNRKGITVATDLGEDGRWRTTTFVPRGIIVRVKVIDVGIAASVRSLPRV